MNVNLRYVGVKLWFRRKGRQLTSFLRNSAQNRTFNVCENLREKQRGPPKTQRLLRGTNVEHQCQKFTLHSSWIRTLSCLDISGVCQVPLHADYHVFKTRETDGGRDVVRDTLFEQNRCVGREFRVCGERRDEGRSIVVPCRMRDNISCPSQGKRHRRKSRGDV